MPRTACGQWFSAARQLKGLGAENTRLEKLLAAQVLENEVIKDALRKSGDRASAKAVGAEQVREGAERAARLMVAGMSVSALRYEPGPHHNIELREQIVALAHLHRCCMMEIIHPKLRQKRLFMNYKRVERPYQEALLQLILRERKRAPKGERQSCCGRAWLMSRARRFFCITLLRTDGRSSA